MSKSGMEFKSTMDREQVAVLLEDLARSIRKGTVCAQQEPEYLTLSPTDVIEVEFEAAQKKGKEKVGLELSWRQEVLGEESASGFKISAKTPEVKPEPKPEAKAAPTQPECKKHEDSKTSDKPGDKPGVK